MCTDEIICYDWGLDVAAAESNLQFLVGEGGTCVCVCFVFFLKVPPPHNNHPYPSTDAQFISLNEHQSQVFHITAYLRVIRYDMKIAICSEKVCLS